MSLDHPPEFLANNRELWKAWGEVQAGSAPMTRGGKGWLIESGRHPSGNVTITLSVLFVATPSTVPGWPKTRAASEKGLV